MAVLLTYDLTSSFQRIRAELKKRGYKDQIVHQENIYNLPNKTFWHEKESHTPEKVLKELKEVIRLVNLTVNPKIELIRVITVRFEPSAWASIADEESSY
ncbi:hypothetical protein [Xanthocytophaga agilis]|uniref:Uncharacterized protein n=1 Tax=Xanthocytophaga agilis TaxID=3048010 RepID=A0AAE3RDX6_9BACT|nr:hypothetical protein [Xanthocytophaga agilis]MDJ1506950.1 hypothetical protein [Xanthocytophaga agilis]